MDELNKDNKDKKVKGKERKRDKKTEAMDSENKFTRVKDHSPSATIKSTAVVKYTAVQSPVSYARLQCNTDLNLPPSNWSSTVDSYGMKEIVTPDSGISSFRMAHMFPDCVGSVDVIAGAECMKNLLKTPYQPNSTVSTIVHRVENTLLLDELRVYDYLMENEWPWLKKFFYENINKTMSDQERLDLIAKQAGHGLKLTTQFLWHSVASCPQPEPLVVDFQPAATPMIEGPHLPEPETSQSSAHGPSTDHIYSRNVLWTFENIQMLIGSDLPIFGGKDRPCVSLKLRDAREPINVLTGIDYWLDNLMCNVPEVVMCYHIDGIVQKYEPLKTEDLPNLDGSKFSPKVIRNVAQNILSFLKSNATKAGHTYWLFKGPHDEVVKLYDLTSLCGGLDESRDETEDMDNPFTIPVAMLLYRVARNMRMTNRMKHVKELLENAIKLLKQERHPQIVASSHYMLADLYVPAATNPACPNFAEKTSEDSEGEEEDAAFNIPAESSASEEASSERDTTSHRLASKQDDTSSQLALQMGGLALHDIGKAVLPTCQEEKSKVPGLGTDPPSRCGSALRHAHKGLMALHHIKSNKSQDEERERLKQQIILEEQNPKMANPYKPIKMNYQPLATKKGVKKSEGKENRSKRRKREKKTESTKYALDTPSKIDKNAILIRKENNVFPTWYEPNRDDNFAWKLHLKTLLYEKICLVYATLAEFSYAQEQFGFSLKYIDLASKCQKLLSNMIIKSRVVDASCLIGRVGDNYFQFYRTWAKFEKFKVQFEKDHETDKLLRQEIESDMTMEIQGSVVGDEFNLGIKLPQSDLEAMTLSREYYKLAIHVTDSEKRNELLRRLASANNELGVRYMSEAQNVYKQYSNLCCDCETQTDEMKGLLKQFHEMTDKSVQHLNEALDIFRQVDDAANLALLYCNKCRYLRFRAHCDIEHVATSSGFRNLYNEGEELYKAALRLLGPRESCVSPDVYELVSWELSSHTFTRATYMQDHPSNYFNEANEVAEALKHALKYCNLTPGTRQLVYQFRAASIHYRLASLYHRQYRDTDGDNTRSRRLFTAARTNYEAAATLFALTEDSRRYLTSQLELVALWEAQAANMSNLKLKSLQTAFQIQRQCLSIIKYIRDRDPAENVPRTDEQGEFKNDSQLLSLLENRIHYTLKSMIQYCRSKSNKDYERMTDMYKKLYSISLKIKKSEDLREYAVSVCTVLEAMDEIVKVCE